jgi:hypothetical protein
MTVQAIETRYAGHRFRSRLEARWAVCFHAMRIRWEYEKEGFEFSKRAYLPDFWLPEYRIWFEVKGDDISKEDRDTLEHFAISVGPIILSEGSIGEHRLTLFCQDTCESGGGLFVERCQFGRDVDEEPPRWTLAVDDVRLCSDRSLCDHKWNPLEIETYYSCEAGMARESTIRMAVEAARSARFEHGEQG